MTSGRGPPNSGSCAQAVELRLTTSRRYIAAGAASQHLRIAVTGIQVNLAGNRSTPPLPNKRSHMPDMYLMSERYEIETQTLIDPETETIG